MNEINEMNINDSESGDEGKVTSDFNRRERWFSYAFLLGFLLKYNYLLIRIFTVPSFTGLIMRNIAFLVLIGYFLLPLARARGGRKILLRSMAVFTAFFIANLWYNRYFGNYLSFFDLIGSEDVGNPMIIFRHLISIFDVIFFVDIVIMTVLRKDRPQVQKKEEKDDKIAETRDKTAGIKLRDLIPGSLMSQLIILALAVTLIFSQMLMTNQQLGGRSPHELYLDSTAAFVNVYGLTSLYLYEVYDFLYIHSEPPASPSPEDLPEELLRNELDGKAEVPEDTNIIVIQVESLDEKLMNYEHRGHEVVPFLNSFKDESIYAENFYAMHVNGSFDADFSLLTSLYPLNRTYAFRDNDMSQFASIVDVLNTRGYETMAFHGNDKSFFHRDKAYPELGFDRFYGREDYSSEKKVMDEEDFYLGINDYDFFLQSLDYLEEAEEPFFGYFITVTSHTPFDSYPSNHYREEFADIETQILHDFFQSISFADRAIERFYQELEARGLDENTLFMIYSDHDASIDTEQYSSSVQFELDREVKQPEHIPLMIRHPDLAPGRLEKTGTITDLAPTLLDLLGAEEKPREFLGTSLFQGEESPVFFLHEVPQILYRDHLFLRYPEKIEHIGSRRDARFEDIQDYHIDTDRVDAIIDYMRQIMPARLREHAQ